MLQVEEGSVAAASDRPAASGYAGEYDALYAAGSRPENADMPLQLILGLLSGPASSTRSAYVTPQAGSQYLALEQLNAVITQMRAVTARSALPGAAVGARPGERRTSGAFAVSRCCHEGCAAAAAPRARTSSAPTASCRTAIAPAGAAVRSLPGSAAMRVRGGCATTATMMPQQATALQRHAAAARCTAATPTATSTMHALDRELRRSSQRRASAMHLPMPNTKLPPHFMASLTRATMSNGPLGERTMLPATLQAWDSGLQKRHAPQHTPGRPSPDAMVAELPTAHQVQRRHTHRTMRL